MHPFVIVADDLRAPMIRGSNFVEVGFPSMLF